MLREPREVVGVRREPLHGHTTRRGSDSVRPVSHAGRRRWIRAAAQARGPAHDTLVSDAVRPVMGLARKPQTTVQTHWIVFSAFSRNRADIVIRFASYSYLDSKDANLLEYKLDAFSSVYRNLTGKDVKFEFPVQQE